jgi:hypothetical protein
MASRVDVNTLTRLAHQQHRMIKLTEAGKLNLEEIDTLNVKLKQIVALHGSLMADGTLDRTDKQEIRVLQDQLASDITYAANHGVPIDPSQEAQARRNSAIRDMGENLRDQRSFLRQFRAGDIDCAETGQHLTDIAKNYETDFYTPEQEVTMTYEEYEERSP